MVHRGRVQGVEKFLRLGPLEHGAFCHAVMQQIGNLLGLLRIQAGFGQQAILQGQAVFHQSLDALDRETAVVRNVGGLGGPGAHCAKTGRHHDRRAILGAVVWITIGQQGREFGGQTRIKCLVAGHQMHKTGRNAGNLVVYGLQLWQKLLNTKAAQSVAALKCRYVQGHCRGLNWGLGKPGILQSPPGC